ncbi:glycoside hydrolase family 9 protein, partial [Anaeromicropila populeti]
MKLVKKMVGTTLIASLALSSIAVGGKSAGALAASSYNYAEVLQKSLVFYELQESGPLQDDIRTNWRSDTCLTDGQDNGLDLTGGWFDAGDHVKFNLPMSYTAAMLAWSYYEDPEVYQQTGQDEYILEQIKFANDYFIKCHPTADKYYFQVGDGGADHAFWGAAEIMQMDRPSYYVDASHPGSCVAASTAASLAAASVIFAESDPAYAATCIAKAKSLLALAETMASDTYYNSVAGAYYRSYSGYADDISWASTWIYMKTGEESYLNKAMTYSNNWEMIQGTTDISYDWTQSWDNKQIGTSLLLARLTQNAKYVSAIENNLKYWSVGLNGKKINYTPKGLAFRDTWGSLRYASTEAFLASVYAEEADCDATLATQLKAFAKAQADYCLGSTGRSFVCGFGENAPVNPHHRTAHGGWENNCGGAPATNRHTLVGALVGGPGSDDSYTDDRTNYVNNEVATDYNAGFTGLMAKMYKEYGGTVLSNVSAVETVGEEIYLQAGINAQDLRTTGSFIEIKSVVFNHTAWPARITDKLTYRYFVDISQVIAAGYSASNMEVSANYKQHGETISALKPWDEEKGIYYVEISLVGAKIYPGGQSEQRSECQFRIKAPCLWDYTTSPSFQGLTGTSNNSCVNNPNMAVYDDGVLVYGKEPNGSAVVTPTPVVTPT